MADEIIRGYRIYGDRPKQRELSQDYLLQTPKAARLLKVLWSGDAKCAGEPEKFTSDDLPSDREAQLACSSCAMLEVCREYAEEAHPAHGIWGGRVYGRNLKAAMEEGESDGGVEEGSVGT